MSIFLDEKGPFGLSKDFAINLTSEMIGIFIGSILIAFTVEFYRRYAERRRLRPFYKAICDQLWFMISKFDESAKAISDVTHESFDLDRVRKLIRHNAGLAKNFREILDYSMPVFPKQGLAHVLTLSRTITWMEEIYSDVTINTFDDLDKFRKRWFSSSVPTGTRQVDYEKVFNHFVERFSPISVAMGQPIPQSMKHVPILVYS